MQTDEQKNKILQFAENDERIRAILLNGSRANPNIKPDQYQDYDVVFIVDKLEEFLKDRNWIYHLGNPVLQQLPDEMELGKNENSNKVSFTFLTIFDDGHRIDLTLFPLEKLKTHFKKDSLTIVWLDKDNYFESITETSDEDYHVLKPNQQEFSEVCNEFWWTITNVAKALKRTEIILAKSILENTVRPMFLKVIEWSIGNDYNFNISVGKSGKLFSKFIDKNRYNEILKTYAGTNFDENWNALLLMTKIFSEEQFRLAEKLDFDINAKEAEQSIKYITKILEE